MLRIGAQLQMLDAELTRIEHKQAHGIGAVHDLERLIDAWRDLWGDAAGAYVDPPHVERLERFRARARAARASEA